MATKQIARVLIYRVGSIGDFVIALPCFHAVRRRYPNAQIALLTNMPADARASFASCVLENTGLVDKILPYSAPLSVLEVRRQIRSFSPGLLVYLADRLSAASSYRDYAFFRWACGVKRCVGIPFLPSEQKIRPPKVKGGLWESEAARLARCLAPHFGAIDVSDAKNCDLRLSPRECAEAESVLRGGLASQFGQMPILGLSIGTKQLSNDWGIANWRAVLEGLRNLPVALVFLGGDYDRSPSQTLVETWKGPAANLCGSVSPRVSAAILRHVALFLCHDSGPMHLAAAVGTPCIAVFSRLFPPGRWYPFGSHHRIFYPPSSQSTIQAIRPETIIAAVQERLRDSADNIVAPQHWAMAAR